MATPKQATEAADLAVKLHEQMYSQGSDEDEDPQDETNEDELENDESEGDEEEVDEDNIPHDDDLEELRKFKSRYLSLQGKYNAEVPRLQSELRDLKTSVFEKLSTIAENPAQTRKEETQENDVIARLKEEYGDDFIDSVKALAEQIADEKIKASLTPVQEKMTSVEDTQIKVAQEKFKEYLDTTVKGEWRTAWDGKDPKFLEFLTQSDPSGLYTYGDLVQLYVENWESEKLSNVLNKYYESKPVKKEKIPNPDREAMVAPSRQNAHVAPDVTDKEIWTKDSIKEFQRLDRQGKFSPEESLNKWNDLLAAANEGRIR